MITSEQDISQKVTKVRWAQVGEWFTPTGPLVESQRAVRMPIQDGYITVTTARGPGNDGKPPQNMLVKVGSRGLILKGDAELQLMTGKAVGYVEGRC